MEIVNLRNNKQLANLAQIEWRANSVTVLLLENLANLREEAIDRAGHEILTGEFASSIIEARTIKKIVNLIKTGNYELP